MQKTFYEAVAVVLVMLVLGAAIFQPPCLANHLQGESVQTFNDGTVNYNGVHFKVDKQLAGAARAQTIPESLASSTQAAPADTIYPRHSVFELMDVITAPKSFMKPEITVYSVREYERAFAADRELASEVRATIAKLRKILRSRNPNFAGAVPLLPIPDGYLAFRSHVAFIKFRGGTGLVYVTQGQQDEMPINNQNLSYEFEGLTDDGRTLVLASFPLAAPFLAYNRDDATYEGKVTECNCFSGPRYRRFQREYGAYVREMKTKLNQLPAAQFQPKLQLYNQLLSSIEVREQ